MTETTSKYSVNTQPIEILLSWVKSGEVAIPELQRPFVWDATKVRDLIDSLYKGFPVGYIIVWKNPAVKLKNGKTSEGKKILIDGQQRITALTAAILGQLVMNDSYKKVKIQIAFNPIEEKFEVFNNAIAKDSKWLPDIADIMSGKTDIIDLIPEYAAKHNIDRTLLRNRLRNLELILQKQIGIIELASDLDIEVVTEIFIRINSKGVVLSQADFAMSKIAANEVENGSDLRKCIDYFCHLAKQPGFYTTLVESDKDFTQTDYFSKISWLKNDNENLYDPDYHDVIRVAFTSEFNRGKLADLVSLLSGRNFETRTYDEEIVQQSFASLKKGVLNFINEINFNRFLLIIKSTGFISPSLIRSQNALNFAYILYLKLKELGYKPGEIENYVKKWFVLSILTQRYSMSPESQFDFDIKNIVEKKFGDFLVIMEQSELSDAFWDTALVQHLDTSVSSSSYFHVFLASQVKANDKGFLSKGATIHDMIAHGADIHHIFPKDYLMKNGLKRDQYNQIANYVYTQSEINIAIKNKPPKVYFGEIEEQIKSGNLQYGSIVDKQHLHDNLKMNCVPESITTMNINNYEEFLKERRKLMAQKIKEYYWSL